MELLKFAAIDIGSNAIRLLFSHVVEGPKDPSFKKASLIRVPVRLGEDVFTTKKISAQKAEKLKHTMYAFMHLIHVHNVIELRACATSAMREAENGPKIIEDISKETGIDIEIINGKQEAEIIFSTQIANAIDNNRNYLYIDVGGGSTEITVFSKGKGVISHSFEIGTIRLLKNQVSEKEKKFMKAWITEKAEKYGKLSAIGSGGNINKLSKMAGKAKNEPMKLSYLYDMQQYISSFSFEDRIRILDMNPDRADVIIPATDIFISIMDWGSIKEIYAPKFGLADGIVRLLYQKHKDSQKVTK